MNKPHADGPDESGEPERASTARSPLQARGRARIVAVLDATAELIVEKGLVGVTMHGVARRAQTPIGSMYHFFPDRESLLTALWDRHMAATQAIDEELDRIDTASWLTLSSEAVIDRFMTPYIEYLERNADCLILMSERPHDEHKEKKGHHGVLHKVIDARMPGVKPAERTLYVEMLRALAGGALAVKLRPAMGDVQLARRYLREVKRALAAYLASVEKAVGVRE